MTVDVKPHAFKVGRSRAEDGILASEVVDGLGAAAVVEDYPAYLKGPCTLVLQRDRHGSPIHVVWHPKRAAVAGGAGHCLSARSGSLDGRLPAEEGMNKRSHTKLVREGL
jgi:hypothetical protein